MHRDGNDENHTRTTEAAASSLQPDTPRLHSHLQRAAARLYSRAAVKRKNDICHHVRHHIRPGTGGKQPGGLHSFAEASSAECHQHLHLLPGGVLVCKSVPFVQTMAIVTGILTMTSIAVERYQGIVHPLKMKRQYTPQRAYKVLGLVWTAAVIVGSPMLFVQKLEVKYDFLYDRHHVCCQECWHSPAHRRAYATFILVALFLLPLATMLILYTRIGIVLWIHKRVGDSSVLNAMNHSEINKISRKKKRAVKMMVTIVLLFTVCWAPFHTVHMLFEYNDLEKRYDDVTLNTVIAIVQAVGFFNSFNNPVVYAFMNENFKKHCKSALSCCPPWPGPPPLASAPAAGGPRLAAHFPRWGTSPRDRPKLISEGNVAESVILRTVRTETSTAFVEEKVSAVNSELPASCYIGS